MRDPKDMINCIMITAALVMVAAAVAGGVGIALWRNSGGVPTHTEQGCVVRSDGVVSRSCDMQIGGQDGADSVCVLDDGAVCWNACDPCALKVDGVWTEVDRIRHETEADSRVLGSAP